MEAEDEKLISESAAVPVVGEAGLGDKSSYSSPRRTFLYWRTQLTSLQKCLRCTKLKKQNKTPHVFLDAVGEAASKGGKLAALTAKRKTENGLEAPRATVPLGGGAERAWSS